MAASAKVKIVIDVEIDTLSTFGQALREKALLILQAKHCKLKELPIPDGLKARYDELTTVVDTCAFPLLRDGTDLKVDNVYFESTDFLTKEEEAAISAPQG